MANVKAVEDAAKRLYGQKDETALEVLVGLREKAIERDPLLKDNPDFEPKYDGTVMGPLDDIKSLGKKILRRWNKGLYDSVCGNNAEDSKERKAILDSLNLGEAAVVAAVASALLSLGVAAAIAAAVAPFLVKKFIWPAKDELCKAWGEEVRAQGFN
jgi:hypothetical protein